MLPTLATCSWDGILNIFRGASDKFLHGLLDYCTVLQ
jgi:hypothetical protein